MRSSLEDAIPILNKWKADSSEIAVAAEDLRWHLRLRGRVSKISFSPKKRTGVILLKGESGALRLTLTDALFKYQEPREAPLSIREEAEAEVVCSLSIRLPGGGPFFVLYELREREGDLR